jgi:hypothetical protein
MDNDEDNSIIRGKSLKDDYVKIKSKKIVPGCASKDSTI